MTMSIRNQLPGTVTAVHPGEVMATAKIRLAGGQDLTAAITLEAVRDLGLSEGTSVRALVKSTEVSLATEHPRHISIRNQLPGTVSDVSSGAAMATVKVAVDGGGVLTSAITQESADDLGLKAGDRVVALIKSTEVALTTT
ncbi:TOBE domain-containing protein [Streptomyces sp. NPDC047085]|jgi:molybdate transport system regulatory protein|uniref:TOBE domain-containing protein n=1 Tax=Streptomyces sp. NPDC047085 TaxID=3155140 RepID=UPI0033CA3EBB